MSSQSSKHYTQEDRQTILRLKNEGKSTSEIAQQLDRTTVAIRHQIWKMKKMKNKYDFISPVYTGKILHELCDFEIPQIYLKSDRRVGRPSTGVRKMKNKCDFISQQQSESDDQSDSSDTEQENSAPMHHYSRWNKAEEIQLREFMIREVSVDEISKTLGRSNTSIKAKWQKIKALSHFTCPYQL